MARTGGLRAAGAALLALAAAARAGGFGARVVYGADDRVEAYAAPPEWRRLAESTAAVFKGDKVAPDGGLVLESFARRHNMCPGQRFTEQPSGSYCSASLVAPDVVLTAGHCLFLPSDRARDTDVPECGNMKFVFGYALARAGDDVRRAAPGDVYRCSEVLAREYPGTGARLGDYALIRLDRPAAGRAPLALERGRGPARGDPVAVIGNPSGLPTKVAAGATVRDADDPWFFVADLDSFGGNSGAAVFDARTKRLVGLVARGETDYRPGPSGGCNVVNVKPQDGGRGEDVVKLARVLPALDAAARVRLGAKSGDLEASMRRAAAALSGEGRAR